MKNLIKTSLTILIIIGGLSMIFSCSPNIKDYKNATPSLDIKQYLNGNFVVKGLLKNRQGKVIRQFSATVKGSFTANSGTLVERFIFNDGEEQDRIWQINFIDDNNFTATAGDVVGVAKGVQMGNAVNMKYVLSVPYGKTTINISMEDWIFLLDSKHAMNTTIMTKFGFKVGELVIFFEKLN
jgi:hypothetical protein